MMFFISSFFLLETVAQDKIWFDVNRYPIAREKAVYYTLFSGDTKKNQLVVDYYVSGKKAKQFYFFKGKREGKSIEFYTTGEVKTTGKFEDGFRGGMWKTYYKSGEIKEKGKYKKGKKVGVWKFFYKNN